jgi:hypothetical protein
MAVYTDVGAHIMELYRQRVRGHSRVGQEGIEARKADAVERKLRLAGLRAERDELYGAARNKELSDELGRRLVREVDCRRLGSGQNSGVLRCAQSVRGAAGSAPHLVWDS